MFFLHRLKFYLDYGLLKQNVVKPVYNDHPRDAKFVAVVDRTGGRSSDVRVI
jgi:hypothetical protein